MRTRMKELVLATQNQICDAIAAVDGNEFRQDDWDREGGGGGWSRVLENGNVFEKGGVNVSVVHGSLSPEATAAARHKNEFGGGEAPFYATGISLVIHPHNPMAPTVHANYRYFELGTEDNPVAWWFGGGADLTPSYLFDEDAVHFHQVHRDACDAHDPEFYPRFKKWCDEYFHIKHRGETRGIGGIFFDDLGDRDQEALFQFVSSCAGSFVSAYVPIVERRKDLPFTEEQKIWQQIRRGRYVEFNLVYDRGTKFGLQTSARTESLLMSLPLTARWQYDHHPEPGTEEARLVDVLREPRDWLGIES